MVMSSTAGMDISETFRPEDLSKTDFFDFVNAPDMGIGVERPQGNDGSTAVDQPLQGYDQFWGAEKDSNRFETAIFEDLNRYCWNQQTNTIPGVNPAQSSNTDGHIYTLTVLNGSESWLKREPSDTAGAPSLDLDTLLGNFPGYVKTEYPYDDSGFSTEHKEDILSANQTLVTNSLSNPNLSSYQNNNNNDWHMTDHNNTEQDSPESLLRSALQGKGYAKGMQLQNGISILPPHTRDVKSDEELRRALFATDQENLTFADSTLTTPLFDDHTHTSCNSPNSSTTNTPSIIVSGSVNSGVHNGVDDMFLTLDSAFTDDFEKIKRIATEVQQFCVTGEAYPEVIIESATVSLTPNDVITISQPIITTTVSSSSSSSTSSTTSSTTSKITKKYKRANSNNNNSITHNNNSSSNSNNNSTSNNNSPTQCNGQRKERALHYCSICSKGFKDKYSVNVHIRTHTGEKPFACSLCGKSFRQKAHLAKHYQTHLAQKNPAGVVKGSKNNNINNQSNNNNNNNTNNNLNTSTNGLPVTGPVVTR